MLSGLDEELLGGRRNRRKRGATQKRTVSLRQALSWLGQLLRLLALIALLAALYIGGQRASDWLLDPAVFPLRHIKIKGEIHYLKPETLSTLLGKHLGENFFRLDLREVHQALSAEAWVEHIELRRLWPDTLEVRVLERAPYALWSSGEMVDVKGKRFRPDSIPTPERWPLLSGPDGHELNLIARYAEANALTAKANLRIRKLRQDERRAWWIELDNGIELSLGREAFMPRLQRFTSLYPKVLAARALEIARVDLRYANGFAVRWRNTPPNTGGANNEQTAQTWRLPSAGLG